ncbi:unnamed protein product [Chondrus crispus]|uniref:Uncharacterized protein n=1 Tax=Chondrus crispus TaxID=2769 RepID=R7QD71_CHOCR|nr:unnamed protein product [Chondrus crispus]CDF35391.1 unnamed protein product [Chondrus crispus]|eukprot:XP_005715210.1 unnamed protein product [Chondrus crispus]
MNYQCSVDLLNKRFGFEHINT